MCACDGRARINLFGEDINMGKFFGALASIGAVAAIAAGIAFIPGAAARADGEIKINDTNFPDAAFRSYVLNDLDDGDQVLTPDEIANIQLINISGSSYTDLTGIKFFTSLENLEIDHATGLETLDLGGMKSLVNLKATKGVLTEIDLKGCTGLKQIDVTANKLSEITFDVSDCVNLEYLDCPQNQIKRYNFNKNKALRILKIYDNPLDLLIIDDCSELVYLDCEDTLLEELYLGLPKLETLRCGAYEKSSCELWYVDVSRCIALKTFRCTDAKKLSKIYGPSEAVSRSVSGTSAPWIVLTKEDWKLTDAVWFDDDYDGWRGVEFFFGCQKSGEEDYVQVVKIYADITSEDEPTCEDDGYKNYKAVLPAALSYTGEEIVETNQAIYPKKGHDWSPWEEETPAEVGKAGRDYRVCYRCSATEFRDTPALKATATPTSKPTATPTTKPSATPTSKPTVSPTSKPSVTPAAKPDKVSLTLDKETAKIVCGKTQTLKATLTGSTSKISWKTSDKKVAIVDGNGKIRAKMAGTVTITATAAGKSATCTVTVLYKDVTDSSKFWYKPTNYLTASGVVKGYDKQTKFKPANKCTRAQMVTFIWRLAGEPEPASKKCKFSDVKEKDYFYKACIWGNENHIVEGYKDGTFGPQIICARRHAVTFLWRLAEKPEPTTKKNKFKDVKKKDYFYKATLWASEEGILAGYKDGTFKPDGDCLRRQMVTFLYKYDKYINDKG